jgi:hypothetical protein
MSCARQCVAAVHALHPARIAHLDLKLNNSSWMLGVATGTMQALVASAVAAAVVVTVQAAAWATAALAAGAEWWRTTTPLRY